MVQEPSAHRLRKGSLCIHQWLRREERKLLSWTTMGRNSQCSGTSKGEMEKFLVEQQLVVTQHLGIPTPLPQIRRKPGVAKSVSCFFVYRLKRERRPIFSGKKILIRSRKKTHVCEQNWSAQKNWKFCRTQQSRHHSIPECQGEGLGVALAGRGAARWPGKSARRRWWPPRGRRDRVTAPGGGGPLFRMASGIVFHPQQ